MAIGLARAPHSAGVSLIEMLFVVGLAAILLALGVPYLGDLLRSARLSSLTNDLLVELHLARSEAIRRGQRVVLCKAANDATCAVSGGWDQGWLLFEDTDNNGTRDGGERVVRYRSAAPAGWRITGNALVSRYVSYDPVGTTKLIGGGFQAGTLTICAVSASAAPARQIVINSTGRPRTQPVQLSRCD